MDYYYWQPLTWLSHMIDCQLFGLRAGWHHFTSLLFHIANVLLLFGVLLRLTAAFWRSALVAAIFALHPTRIESVVWIAERKDLLSGFFFLAAIWCYLRYTERPSRGRYNLVFGRLRSGPHVEADGDDAAGDPAAARLVAARTPRVRRKVAHVPAGRDSPVS